MTLERDLNRSIRSTILLCLLLTALTVGVYWHMGNHEFINYDDNDYITENPHMASGITAANIIWAFSTVEVCNWHPVTWLSHLADAQLYGMDPRGHYLTNVAVHAAAALILLLFLFRFTGSMWQSFFVAALFAIHPLHVESVAWVAERKDLLSALFCFITLYLYGVYVKNGKRGAYILALIFFVLGLMSKPMIVTLPVILLLLDYWPLKRASFHAQDDAPVLGCYGSSSRGRLMPLLKEKLPFFALSLLFSAITIYTQQKGGSVTSLNAVSFWLRLENSFVSYLRYILKTFWPQKLAIIYPYPASITFWQAAGSLSALLLVSVLTILVRRKYPYLPVGWFWFIVTLLPVIGLIQVGEQSMADRYTYIPIIGLFIMVAWGVPELINGFRYRRALLSFLTFTVIVTSITVTWNQLGYWQNGLTLFRHATEVTERNCVAHYNLGAALFDRGDVDGGVRELRTALAINPNDAQAHNNLAIALDKKGDKNGAIHEFKQSLAINPNNFEAHYNLGIALLQAEKFEEATVEFRNALDITPNESRALYYLELARPTRKK